MSIQATSQIYAFNLNVERAITCMKPFAKFTTLLCKEIVVAASVSAYDNLYYGF